MSQTLDRYKKYLEICMPDGSDSIPSYVHVVDKIGGIINQVNGFEYVPVDFSSVTNLDLIWKVYQFAKVEQKKPNGGVFSGSALSQSYWEHGYCSAAIRSFLNYRIEEYVGTMPVVNEPMSATAQLPISNFQNFISEFVVASKNAGLNYDDKLLRRVLSAPLAKSFVVLTGLSGSGKTKLAQVIAGWLSLKGVLSEYSFKIGTVFGNGAYKIVEADAIAYKILVASTGRLRTVPKTIINQWIEYYKQHPEVWNVPSQTVKDIIKALPGPDDNYMHGNDGILANIAKDPLVTQMQPTAVSMVNSILVPVGADWTNSEKLLGYPDALHDEIYVMPDTGVLKLMMDAEKNPTLPFFLILDEMNLSHVERYFADFLSVMESGDEIELYDGNQRYGDKEKTIAVPRRIRAPKNLFVIGTMNVDETTYMFSPKVLDRAQVIEFRVDKGEMAAFLDNPTTPNLDAIAGKGAKYAEAFLKLKDNPPPLDEEGKSDNKNAINAALKKFFEPLAELGAEFGYRTAGEVIRFCRYYLAAGATIEDAIDAAIVQKLLPKLHGSQQRLAPVLRKLKELASTTAMQQDGDGEAKKIQLPLYKLTCEKLDRMLIRLKANGFTSFAEA